MLLIIEVSEFYLKSKHNIHNLLLTNKMSILTMCEENNIITSCELELQFLLKKSDAEKIHNKQ